MGKMDRNKCLKILRERAEFLEKKIIIKDKTNRGEPLTYAKEECEALYMAIGIILAERGTRCAGCGRHFASKERRIEGSIKSVDETPANASEELNKNLKLARLWINKPLCGRCTLRIEIRGEGLIHFETEAETVQKVMQEDVIISA